MDEITVIENRLEGYKLLKTALEAIYEFNQNRDVQDVPTKAHMVLGYVNTGHIAKVEMSELDGQIKSLENTLEVAKNVMVK